MNVRLVTKEDFSMIESWCHGWNVPKVTNVCSNLGYIVDDVAAGWLYITNSPVAFVEHLITNPKSGIKLRNKALDLVVLHIANVAKDMDFKHLIGITNLDVIRKRAEKLKFNTDTKLYQIVQLTLKGNK